MSVLTPAQSLAATVALVPKPDLKPRASATAPDQVHRMVELDRAALIDALKAALPSDAKAFEKLGANGLFLARVLQQASRTEKPTVHLDRHTIDRILDLLKPAPVPAKEPTGHPETATGK